MNTQPYRYLIIRDNRPHLYVRLTNLPNEEFIHSKEMPESAKIIGEEPLPGYMEPINLELLLKYDKEFNAGNYKRFLEQTFLAGIRFQKNRPAHTSGDGCTKDHPEW